MKGSLFRWLNTHFYRSSISTFFEPFVNVSILESHPLLFAVLGISLPSASLFTDTILLIFVSYEGFRNVHVCYKSIILSSVPLCLQSWLCLRGILLQTYSGSVIARAAAAEAVLKLFKWAQKLKQTDWSHFAGAIERGNQHVWLKFQRDWSDGVESFNWVLVHQRDSIMHRLIYSESTNFQAYHINTPRTKLAKCTYGYF